MTGVLEALKTRINEITDTRYVFGSDRGEELPVIQGLESESNAGQTAYQTGGPDIQTESVLLRVWSTSRSFSKQLGELLVDKLAGRGSLQWRPTWDNGKLLDAFQEGLTVTKESDTVDSNNQVIWLSESVVEFVITRE